MFTSIKKTAILIFALITAHANAAPMNSSIILNDLTDYAYCSEQVDKAALLGNDRVHIVPFVNMKLNLWKNVSEYCYVEDSVEEETGTVCQSVDNYFVDTIRHYLKECFERAVENNLEIAITPYMEEFRIGDGSVYWRNRVSMDPLKQHKGFSFKQALIDPIVEAIAAGVPQETFVEFSLEGEMGESIRYHSEGYEHMLLTSRNILKNHWNLRMGISLNYSNVFGFLASVGSRSRRKIQSLFDKIDFIGVSAYREVSYPTTVENFQNIVYLFLDELRGHKIVVPKELPVRLTEVGLGGGLLLKYTEPAKTPQQAAESPFSGVRGEYREDKDPWKNPALRDFRRQYHRTLMKFLANPNLGRPVTGAYIWSLGSWDVQGLSEGFEDYKDEVITEDIKKHNSLQ